MPAFLTALATAVPTNSISQIQTVNFMTKAYQLNEFEQKKMRLFYKNAGISNRNSVLADYNNDNHFTFFKDIPHTFPTTAQRMEVYEKNALPLAIEAFENLRQKHAIDTSQITHLISVSCTGMYAPGIDIEMILNLGLPTTIHRTCINFMGCYAAFNAMKVAKAICEADKKSKVLIIGVELCTLHLQPALTEDDWLANALFADGAAALLVEGIEKEKSWRLDNFYTDLAPQGKNDMAWYIRDFGFAMKLTHYIPNLLSEKMKEMSLKMFEYFGIQTDEVTHYALHPGGKKILENLEKALHITPEHNQNAYEILKNYGNMSSVTIWFVWEKYWNNSSFSHQSSKMLSMAFGPGLTLEASLMNI